MLSATPWILEYLNRENIREALSNNDMGKFYAELRTAQVKPIHIGQLTALLMAAGVDPLQGISKIPMSFLTCQDEIGKIDIPEEITEIGHSAFSSSGIQEVTIPGSVKVIDSFAFYRTPLQEVRLPAAVRLGYETFARTHLKTVETEDAAFTGDATFAYCPDLKSIKVKGTTACLPYGFCVDCQNLSHVELPVTLKSIRGYAFHNCTALETITYTGTVEQWKQLRLDVGNLPIRLCTITCTDGRLRWDKFQEAWVEA